MKLMLASAEWEVRSATSIIGATSEFTLRTEENHRNPIIALASRGTYRMFTDVRRSERNLTAVATVAWNVFKDPVRTAQ